MIHNILKYLIVSLACTRVVVAEITEGEISGLIQPLNPLYSYLSPVNGLAVLRSGTLSNIRFYGNYGPPQPGVECYPQNLTNNANDCAQDHITALIQHLFPAIAGEPLVVNTYGPDGLIRKLSVRSIGVILRVLTEIRAQGLRDPQRMRDQIDRLALAIFEHSYPGDYTRFSNEVRGDHSPKPTNRERAKKLLAQEKIKKLTQEIKGLKAKQKSEFLSREESTRLSIGESERQQLLKEQRGFKEKIQMIGENYSKLLEKVKPLEEYGKCHYFATIILNGLQQSFTYPYDYPPYLVEHTLLAFAWKKAKHKDEFIRFFKALGMPIVMPEFFNSKGEFVKPPNWDIPFSKKDYDDFKEQMDSQEDKLLEKTFKDVFSSPEYAFYVTMAFDTYENFYPPILDFSTAHFPSFQPEEKEKFGARELQSELERRGYPDCGETMIRNFLNVILYDFNNQIFDIDLLGHIAPHADKRLFHFFDKQTLANMESMRDQWSDIVSNIHRSPGRIPIQYSKPLIVSENQKRNRDIQPGMANLFAVMTHLLNDAELNQLEMKTHPQERSQEFLTRLCKMITDAKNQVDSEFNLTWRVQGGGQKIPSDNNTTIEFLVNDDVAFKGIFLPQHFNFKTVQVDQQYDWRKNDQKYFINILREKIKTDGYSIFKNLLPFYVESEDVPYVLKRMSPPLQKSFLSSLIYGSFVFSRQDHLLQALPMIFMYGTDQKKQLNRLSSLVQMAENRWMRELPQDPATYVGLFEALYPYKDSWTEPFMEKMSSLEKIIGSAPVDYLFLASTEGCPHVIEFLLAQNPQLLKEASVKNKEGETPLYKAAENGHLNVVEFLIERNPALLEGEWVKDEEGNTPLHEAARNGHLKAVEFFVEKYPDLFEEELVKNEEGNTPLHMAAEGGYLDVVQLLIKRYPALLLEEELVRDEDGDTPLHKAASGGQLDIVKFFIEQHPDLLEEELVKNDGDNTPLHDAAWNGHLEIVEFLIEKNPDLLKEELVKNHDGNTPIHEAASEGYLNIVKFLVEKNPDLLRGDLVRNKKKRTPLHYATEGGHLNVIKFLVESNPVLLTEGLTQPSKQPSLLEKAQQNGYSAIVEFFLEKRRGGGIEINQPDNP